VHRLLGLAVLAGAALLGPFRASERAASAPPPVRACRSGILAQTPPACQTTGFRLYPAVANPLAEGTIIRYSLVRAADVNLFIYDAVGRIVQVLATGELPAGEYTALWDGLDRKGRRVGSGVYFCKLRSGRGRQTRRVVLLH
jgi:hypothetical protein